jgi:hypothetical protein
LSICTDTNPDAHPIAFDYRFAVYPSRAKCYPMKHSTNAGLESTLAVLIEILQLSTEFALMVADLGGRVLRWD